MEQTATDRIQQEIRLLMRPVRTQLAMDRMQQEIRLLMHPVRTSLAQTIIKSSRTDTGKKIIA